MSNEKAGIGQAGDSNELAENVRTVDFKPGEKLLG